jgi:hypothetical protein
MIVTEMRCPGGHRRLLAKLKSDGLSLQPSQASNLVEFACSDCARKERAAGNDVHRVLHCYNFLGELVETRFEK